MAYLHTFCFIELNRLEEATKALGHLSKQVDMNADKYDYARVQNLYGQVEYRQKHFQLAEHYFKNALTALEMSKEVDAVLKSSALMGIGKAQQESGKLKHSLSAYQQAVRILESRDDLETLGKLYTDMAQNCLRANHVEKAATYSQRALFCLEAVKNTHSKLVLELQIATVKATTTGDKEEAKNTLKRVAEELSKLRKSEDAGIAFAELAKLHFESGKLDQAEAACQSSKNQLLPNHQYYGSALRVQAKIAQSRKQIDLATKLFKQSADCFKSQGCYREFEATMYELSKLFEQQHRPELAFQAMTEMWAMSVREREARGIIL